jgi:hypothetical protein
MYMKKKRKLKPLFISSFLMTILLAGLFSCASMAAATKSPDLNGDMAVNISDVMLLASAFNTSSGSEKYKSDYDLNSDNAINISDVMIIATQFNTVITSTNPPSPTIPSPSIYQSPSPSDDSRTNLTGDIIFSEPSKTFKNQISVTLSSKVANAQIRYTTDGSVPTSSSALYNGALTFTKTTQLRAQSFVNGTASGAMGSAIYIATSIDAKHDIPVIILDAYGKGKPVKKTMQM